MYVSAFLQKLVRKTGMTVIMVSHDLNLSAKYADEVIAMAPPGRLYGKGTPNEVITSDLIRDIYHVDAEIVDDDGKPHVILKQVRFD